MRQPRLLDPSKTGGATGLEALQPDPSAAKAATAHALLGRLLIGEDPAEAATTSAAPATRTCWPRSMPPLSLKEYMKIGEVFRKDLNNDEDIHPAS